MTVLRAVCARQIDVRDFEAPIPLRATPEPDRAEQVRGELAALKEHAAALRDMHERELVEAREDGRREGAEQAQLDFGERTASLAEVARHAVTLLDTRLSAIESLAPMIAEAALAQMFAQPLPGADLVMSAIRRQLSGLRRETVLGIHVSAADFPDAESARAAVEACGNHEFVARPDLSSGDCVIRLSLGEIDIGIPTQAAAMSELLRRLAGESTTP